MASILPKRQAPMPNRLVIGWLPNAEPSVRRPVMADLTVAPASEVAAERARVATDLVTLFAWP